MVEPHEIPSNDPAAAFGAKLRAALPVLPTARLRLRAPQIEDFPHYAEILASPGGRFIISDGSRENAWVDFAQLTGSWLLRGHGIWAVERQTDDEVLGFVLLGFEIGDHEPELGYMFRKAFEGQGYAQEAGEAALAHGLANLPSLVSTIDADNERSKRLAMRLGGVRDPAAEAAHGHRCLVYRYEGRTAS